MLLAPGADTSSGGRISYTIQRKEKAGGEKGRVGNEGRKKRKTETERKEGRKERNSMSLCRPEELCPLPGWQEVICEHLESAARCFEPLASSPSLSNSLRPCQIQCVDLWPFVNQCSVR